MKLHDLLNLFDGAAALITEAAMIRHRAVIGPWSALCCKASEVKDFFSTKDLERVIHASITSPLVY